ncbi:MAG: response regulator [Eisenbergiella sp.]
MISKIVLADDETIQRTVLNQIIQKLSPKTQIILCSDGKEALEAVCSEIPDLLITDIRMPIMDGMELIRRVSVQFPHIRIVLISAYSEFEYAQTAIRCGVAEYLLKPFRFQDVSDILSRTEQYLERQSSLLKKTSLYENMLADSLKQERQMLLSALLDGRKNIKSLDRDTALQLKDNGFVAVFRWKIRLASASYNTACPEYLSENQQEILLNYIHTFFPGSFYVFLTKGLDSCECRLALLLSSHTEDQCRLQLSALFHAAKNDSLVFHAGLSALHPFLVNSLALARQQAEEMLSFSFYHPQQPSFYCWKDFNSCLELPMLSLSGIESDLRTSVKNAVPASRFYELLSPLKKELKKSPLRSPVKVRHRISSMIVSIIRDLDGMISADEYDALLTEAYHSYHSCDSLDSLFSISLSLLERTAAYFSQESGQHDVTEDIITYIKKHLDEDLSLQQLAEKVHFSANYLSAQIKSKTGLSYISYLTGLRTDMACQLLTETDLKVLEIAQRCGYRDSSYFNRIFCRKCGISPEQYRKAHKKC